jgi:hypothetical protein
MCIGLEMSWQITIAGVYSVETPPPPQDTTLIMYVTSEQTTDLSQTLKPLHTALMSKMGAHRKRLLIKRILDKTFCTKTSPKGIVQRILRGVNTKIK